MAQVAVIRFPGSNCEYETERVCKHFGLSAKIYNWNEIGLLSHTRADAYVLPGGFSFQDRIRAGVVAAREAVMELVFEEAVSGKPVLGICNGAQVLVESGLVPGWKPGSIEAALAENSVPGRSGYLSRWVYVKASRQAAEKCPWLRMVGEEAIPLPVAHAEGRFVFREEDLSRASALVALSYCMADGSPADGWPWNPNGSALDAAALMSVEGNVLAVMPHPERGSSLWQVPPNLAGRWGETRRKSSVHRLGTMPGPGAVFFESLAKHLEVR